jgi:hypothetical protein
MASQAQVEANRANAQHSTGPVSEAGKARVACNAIKHGLLAGAALLDTEDAAAYREHCRSMEESLRPQGTWEEALAQRVAAQAWRLKRAMWMETSILDNALYGAVDKDSAWRERTWETRRGEAREKGLDERGVPAPLPRPWPKAVDPYFAGEALGPVLTGPSSLDVLRRYERSIERGMYEAMRELRAAQKARAEGDAADRAAGPTGAPGIQFYGPWPQQVRTEALRAWADTMDELAERRRDSVSPQDLADPAGDADPAEQQQTPTSQQPTLNAQVAEAQAPPEADGTVAAPCEPMAPCETKPNQPQVLVGATVAAPESPCHGPMSPTGLRGGSASEDRGDRRPTSAEEGQYAAEAANYETNPISQGHAAEEMTEARMV